MSREPPPPRNGYPIATSGVELVGRNPCPTARQPIKFGPFAGAHLGSPGTGATPPLVCRSTRKLGSVGLEKFGWLNMLKTSTRNCILSRSFSLVSLARPKSKFLKFGPTKALRPRLPKWKPPLQAPAVGSQLHGAANAPRFSSLAWPPVPAKGSPITSGRSKNSLLLLRFANEFKL